MSKVYLVEAFFDDYESSWSKMIGIFDKLDVAEKIKQKWNQFYDKNKSIFDEPDNWESEPDIGNYGSNDGWHDSNEYWSLKSKYDEISKFREIVITEFITNIDNFVDDVMFRTDPMKELLVQYNRDYKLKEIL